MKRRTTGGIITAICGIILMAAVLFCSETVHAMLYTDPVYVRCMFCGSYNVESIGGPEYRCLDCKEIFSEYSEKEIMPAAPAGNGVSNDVQCTVTYYEYKESKNPSYVTREVTVPQNSYYQIYGMTVKEYKARDGVKYVFSGNWDADGTTYSEGNSIRVSANVSLTPIYDPVYTVTYLNASGKSTFKTFEVQPGEYHRIIAEYPEKKDDDNYSYEFAGWTFNDEVVKGYQKIEYDRYYYPSYNKVAKAAVVTFLDADGNTYQEITVDSGADFKLPTTGPKKASTSTTGYSFAGWAVNGVRVEDASMSANENLVFTPVYTEYRIRAEVTATPVPEEEPDEQDTEDVETEPVPSETEPLPTVTQEPVEDDTVTDATVGESDADVSTQETGSDNDASNSDSEASESPEDSEGSEDIDLEESTIPMGAVVAVAGIGAAGVVGGTAFAISRATRKAAVGTVKAVKAGKTARTAAKAADAAAKAKAVRDIEFESKTVLLAVDDRNLRSELSLLLGRKKFIALKNTKDSNPASIANTAGNVKADIVIIDTLKNETPDSFRQRAEVIGTKNSEYNLVAVSNDSFTSVGEDTFKELKANGTLAGYIGAGTSGNQKMIQLILPAYKPEITVDNTAEFIGRVTDALGIPGVSTVIELFMNGKEIKEALSSNSVDVSDVSTVVGNIASAFGLDGVENVSKLINGIDTAKDIIKTEDVSNV